jgi:uncharacterized protein YjbJ (UPF0337 family)
MDRRAFDKTKGLVKDTVGGIMGDNKLQAQAKVDKTNGEARKAVGDAKDMARPAAQKIMRGDR